jgi:Tfp pilus assembly protein PilF
MHVRFFAVLRRLALAFAFALALSGCVGLPTQSSNQLVEPFTPRSSSDGKLAELPPHKAGEACFATAQALEEHGFEIEAIAQYERALHHYPRLVGVHRRLAVLYDRQGNFQRADAEYRRALQVHPRDPDLLNDYGYYHYQREDYAEAERWLRQALDVAPQHLRAWGNLALVLARQNRLDESLAAFRRVVGEAEAHSNLGILLAQDGRVDEARAHLQRAHVLNPDLPQPRVVLARLERPLQTTPTTVANADAK